MMTCNDVMHTNEIHLMRCTAMDVGVSGDITMTS